MAAAKVYHLKMLIEPTEQCKNVAENQGHAGSLSTHHRVVVPFVTQT
jgi:hypothetical protein